MSSYLKAVVQNAVGLQLSIAKWDSDFNTWHVDRSYLTPINENGVVTISDDSIATIMSIGTQYHVVLANESEEAVFVTDGYFIATE